MNKDRLDTLRNSFLCLALLVFSPISVANPNQDKIKLPAGWSVMALEKLSKGGHLEVEGYFEQKDHKSKAILVENPERKIYGVALSYDPKHVGKIIQTFDALGPNPPSLSLIAPGSYQPHCKQSSSTQCARVHIKNQAIGVSFEESSAQIIYFKKPHFKSIFVTD